MKRQSATEARRAWLALTITLALALSACASTPGPSSPGSPTRTPSSSETGAASPTTTPEPPTGAALTKQLDELVGTMNDFSGAVLITRGNQVLLSHASGVADQKRGTLVTPATRFRIGSLTKQFTAMAILILEHRGRLRIGDRICHYLADCPAAWAPITLGQLLTHSSGIPDFMALTSYPVLSRHPSTPEHTLGLVRNLPLRFVPGSAYEYSNSGYVLLGMVVERASAMTYGAFLQKNIFGPLRMRDTGYDDGHQGVAVGYSSGSTPADPIDMSVLFSAAALYSTVGDLHRWEQSLSAGSLVPTSVVAEMEQPRVKRGNSVADQYGYGVHIDETGDANHPQVRIYHEGRVNGFVSWLSHYPESGIDIAILSNHDDTALTGVDFDDQVRRLILGS